MRTANLMTSKIVVIAMVFLLSGCSRTHSPIYSLSLELEHFDYDRAHELVLTFADEHKFKLYTAWDDSERIRTRKRLIQRIFKRRDGLAYGVRNYVQANCISLSFYDWRKKDIEYEEVKDSLVAYLEKNLPVTKQYPGQTRCREKQQNEQGEIEAS